MQIFTTPNIATSEEPKQESILREKAPEIATSSIEQKPEMANGTTPQINVSSIEQKPEVTVNGSAPSAEGLFSSELISPTVAASLPESYTIRAMRKGDYARGYLDVLRVLTTVGDITEQEWDERYEWMNTQGKGGYYMLVIDDGSRVVGTGALIVERKFIHHLGLVGHIEDIAVASDQQGKKLGLKLIQALDFIAEQVGCYKTILDCSEANEGFYIKCGFKRAGLEMAHYYEKPKGN